MFDLKPCPFCGCKSVEVLMDEHENPEYPWFTQCQMCGAGAERGRTKENAVEAWNRRQTMDELISREATIKRIKEVYCVGCNSYHGVRCRACGTGDAIDIIDDFPAADAAPVVHGRWIRPHWKNSNYCCDCSECGGEAMHRDYQWDRNGIYPICPHCGAKMDGGAENG